MTVLLENAVTHVYTGASTFLRDTMTHICMCVMLTKALGLEELSMTLLIVHGCTLDCLVVINMYAHTYK